MLLQRHERIKLDETEDSLFYSFPRFVTHVDQGFIGQLTTLYQKHLKPQTRILDLMSSWVSHLPPEIQFSHVEGHGMNEEELALYDRFKKVQKKYPRNLDLNPKKEDGDAEILYYIKDLATQKDKNTASYKNLKNNVEEQLEYYEK